MAAPDVALLSLPVTGGWNGAIGQLIGISLDIDTIHKLGMMRRLLMPDDSEMLEAHDRLLAHMRERIEAERADPSTVQATINARGGAPCSRRLNSAPHGRGRRSSRSFMMAFAAGRTKTYPCR